MQPGSIPFELRRQAVTTPRGASVCTEGDIKPGNSNRLQREKTAPGKQEQTLEISALRGSSTPPHAVAIQVWDELSLC